MAQWILKPNGKVIACRTCRPLKEDAINNPVEIRMQQVFDESVQAKLGDSFAHIPIDNWEDKFFKPYEDNEEPAVEIPEVDNDAFDTMLNSELQLPHGNRLQHVKVIC